MQIIDLNYDDILCIYNFLDFKSRVMFSNSCKSLFNLKLAQKDKYKLILKEIESIEYKVVNNKSYRKKDNVTVRYKGSIYSTWGSGLIHIKYIFNEYFISDTPTFSGGFQVSDLNYYRRFNTKHDGELWRRSYEHEVDETKCLIVRCRDPKSFSICVGVDYGFKQWINIHDSSSYIDDTTESGDINLEILPPWYDERQI